jgi:hypothetical protein
MHGYRIIYTATHMALSIRDPETDRLARELARLTGVTMTEAIRTALGSAWRASGRGAREMRIASRRS